MSSKTMVVNKRCQSLSEQTKKLIAEVFNVFDIDGDSQLNYVEFKSACKALGCPTKKVEILKIIKSHQRNGVKDNCIEFTDFFDVCKLKFGKCELYIIVSFYKKPNIYHLYDDNNNNHNEPFCVYVQCT